MEPKGFHRKLTAVLSADVAGYSRLMQNEETAAVASLESYKQSTWDLIKDHQDGVVDSPGDYLLAEFASAVDSVQAGFGIQPAQRTKNFPLPQNWRMEFWIAINRG